MTTPVVKPPLIPISSDPALASNIADELSSGIGVSVSQVAGDTFINYYNENVSQNYLTTIVNTVGGGLVGEVQFSGAGNTFDGDANFLYNASNRVLSVTNVVSNFLVANSFAYQNGTPLVNYTNANVANYLSNGVNTNVSFTGANVSLGDVGNLHIDGGGLGQLLTTDGAGNVSWIAYTPPSPTRIANGNSNVSIATANGNVTVGVAGNANILTVTGTGANISGTANITGNVNVPNLTANGNVSFTGANVSLGDVGNLMITGGSNLQVLSTDGAGNLSWVDNSTNHLANGNSNVTVAANANVTVSVAGNSNILTITGTGANIAGTANVSGNANVGNIGAASGIFTANANVGGNLNVTGNINVTDNSWIIGDTFNVGNSGQSLGFSANGISVAGTSGVRITGALGANITANAGNFIVNSNVANITANTGNVTLTANAKTWLFKNDGNLTVPGNIYGTNSGNPMVIDAGAQGLAFVSIPSFTDGGELLTIQNNYDANTGGIQINTNGYLDLNGADSVNLVSNNVTTITSGSNAWNFANSGILTLPGEGVIRSNNDTVILQSYDTANNIGRGLRIGDTGGLYLEQGSDPTWLTFVANSSNAEISSAANSSITIIANSNPWVFNANGSLTVPAGGAIISSNSSPAAALTGFGLVTTANANIGQTLNVTGNANVGGLIVNSFANIQANLVVSGNANLETNINLTGIIRGGNGNVSAPTYGFTADGAYDTGFYWVSDGVIGVTNQGVQSAQFQAGGVFKQTTTTVDALPSAATAGAGARAFVTDAASNQFANILANGGTYYVPVFSNGTNWYVG
jgi:hypothetical protein